MALIHFNQEGFDKALEGKALMLVDFWATWCGPCRMLGPVIEQLAEDYEGKDVIIGKVDVDENPELAQRYGVMSIPTVLLLEDGKEIDRKVGVMPYEAYADLLDGKL
ncbi:MAG: thioredoxin [Oscillospiraceae bacterium]|nr:thioredoxin [Oscillospiraceae bacterium]